VPASCESGALGDGRGRFGHVLPRIAILSGVSVEHEAGSIRHNNETVVVAILKRDNEHDNDKRTKRDGDAIHVGYGFSLSFGMQ